jgi:hypothetical protein
MKIQADETNGILIVDDFDEYFDELTQEGILIECLKDADCLPLYAEVSTETLQRILDYGYTVTRI